MPRRPKLGQHFLASVSFQERIAQALRLRPDDLVVEVGAGQGAMTGLLASRARRVVAVELDEGLGGRLRARFAGDRRVRILGADILKTNLDSLCREEGAEQCFVFGNLPYYITSPILNHLFDFRTFLHGMALVMQREVAERVAAGPGNRDYGYLSAAAQLFSRPRILFTVPPGAFSPPPKVQSALVEFIMTRRFPGWSREEEDGFLDFAKLCFAQKRKSLLNNLAISWPRRRLENALGALQIPSKARAEQLTLEQLAAIRAAL
jgi:16S rRNA (adenine1518-N6/adenine1519-N6)-dimethyltransferase